MYVSDREWLGKFLTQEALNILVADDFDIFSGLSGLLAYDGGTKIFVVGETITAAGGATGVIAAIDDDAVSGNLTLNDCTGVFINDEAITSPSGGTAVVNGVLGEHTGNWTGFTVIANAVFAAITTGEGVKENVAQTFAAPFSAIADIRGIQLTSGAIMAHKINET